MDAPSVLVVSSTDYDPKELVKQILGVSELPTSQPVIEQIEAYPWHLDTKYYTANINICTTPRRTVGNEQFAENVQGFVLYFDPSQEDGLKKAEYWTPFVNALDPVVQILVCEKCHPSGVVSRLIVQKWCLDNGYELVELNPEENSDSEEEDFHETTGIKRIIQACHAHTWSNLIMKDKPDFRSPYMNQMMRDSALEQQANSQSECVGTVELSSNNITSVLSAITHNNDSCLPGAIPHSIADTESVPAQAPAAGAAIGLTDSTITLTASTVDANVFTDTNRAEVTNQTVTMRDDTLEGAVAASDQSTINTPKSKAEKDLKNRQRKSGLDIVDGLLPDNDSALFSALGNEDPSDESFEQLFEKMRIMKEQAQHLPPDQRKLYAEKIAIQFWKAIGGDEDEIDGLSSGDDDSSHPYENL